MAQSSLKFLLGLKRPRQPAQTLADQSLHPLTVPNVIGLIRLLLIPVFSAVALSSSNQPNSLAVVLFVVIACGDYLDGLVARMTGQYSRFGALLDPLTDRLLILATVIVCWHFDLLPHWALAIVIIREVFMLVIAQVALRKSLNIKINWPGRIAMFPIFGALFFALVGLGVVGEILLYIGLTLALVATGLYLRSGWRLVV